MSVAPAIVLLSNSSDFHQDAIIGHRAYSRTILSKLKLPIPASFVITSTGFYRFLHHDNGLNHWRSLIENAQVFSNEDMVTCARSLQNLVLHHVFDPELVREITSTYQHTLKKSWAHLTISPTPSTAAPVHYPLPVIKGETSLLDFLRQLWAAQLTPHALSLHLNQHKTELFSPAPILVSQFEPALVSGTIYSSDPQSGDKNLSRIETIWGTNPQNDPQSIPVDIIILTKNTGEIISRLAGKQTKQISIDRFGHLKTTPLSTKQRTGEKLSTPQIQTLLQAALKIHNATLTPQAINWLIVDKHIMFTRYSEIPDIKQIIHPTIRQSTKHDPKIIATGLPISPGITTAPLIRPRLHTTVSNRIVLFKEANTTVIKKAHQAAGIIIESGPLTSELAMAAREIGIPILTGTGSIHQPDGTVVTLDASNGKISISTNQPTPLVLPTLIKHRPKSPLKSSVSTATKIYLSLQSYKPADSNIYTAVAGVGQCHGSLLIQKLGIHPKYLLAHERNQLKEMLTSSLETICNGFGDRPVWYYPYDLDTASAANLLHGDIYEPKEEQNPLIGYRGTYRLIHDDAIFSTELESIKQVKHKKNIKNLHLTLPLIRSLNEYKVVKRRIASHGLYQTPTFMLYAEIGTPSALELIPQLANEGINGFHLNLDLLAALLLGYDPNSEEVNACLDYTHPSVSSWIALFVQTAEKYRLPLIAYSDKFNQSSQIIEMGLKAGINAIIANPIQYQNVHYWVTLAEAAALHEEG